MDWSGLRTGLVSGAGRVERGPLTGLRRGGGELGSVAEEEAAVDVEVDSYRDMRGVEAWERALRRRWRRMAELG